MADASEPARSPLLLLDTHVLLWLVDGNPLLSRKAIATIDAAAGADCVLVSAITPWEIGTLARKKRITLHKDPLDWVRSALAMPGIHLAPLSPEIAVGSNQLPFNMHADPADRILVAAARYLNATLVTADKALLNLARKGHFPALNAAR